VVLLGVSLYLAFFYERSGNDPLAFVMLGRCYSACTGAERCPLPPQVSPPERLTLEGYDGQFNYYIARQPLEAAPCIDRPAYRYQRILLPLLGAVLSLGQSAWIPWVFIGVNLAALTLSTAWLEHLLAQQGVWRGYALSYGLFAGVVWAVRLSTSEPLAYALAIGAILGQQRGKLGWAVVTWSLAVLAKETVLILVGGVALYYLAHKQWQALTLVLAGVLGPFILWQSTLLIWLGEWGVGSGGAEATRFEILPFGGIIQLWTHGDPVTFWVQGVLFLGLFVVIPTLWGGLMTTLDWRQPHTVTLYGSLLWSSAAVMPFIPFSTYREYVGILRFMPPLVLGVLLYSAERGYARPLRFSTFWIGLLAFVGSDL
jgi:hypothetical protein